MKNVQLSQDGNTLIIKVDMTQDFGLSKSGKSKVVATTEGFVQEFGVGIGLNVVKK